MWYPNRVVSGWSPYRYGHWDWIAPWGWTWIDDAPWGFAPFHYGRWTEIHHHWCWVPGRREIRAVYAPALVAWVGTPHLSVSINVNGGSIGWIPLGPREVFRPHYHASAVYLSRVNIGGSMLNRDEFEHEIRRDRRDVFANRRAVSVVAAATFTSAATVHRNLITVDARTLNPMESLNQFRPDRAALVGGSHTIQPPVRIINREVVAQRTPAPLVPRPELPARHNVDVGDSVHMINPISPRRGLREDRDETRGDRRFTPPSQNDGLRNDNLREDTGRSDRWGRDGTRFENRQIERGDNNEPQRHEGRVNPPQERRDTVDPNANQQRIDPPQQNQQQEPERRRIGPWVREEQQLRPEPQQQQRNQAPPVNPPPPPRADPPRTFTPPPAPPPPQNDPPPNNQGGERPHRDRREIR